MSLAPRIVVGTAAAVLAIAAGLVKPWEGRELVPYRDIVGVWTVCEGITGDAVVPGRHYTGAECDKLLDTELGKHYAGVAKCITYPIRDHEMAAVVSWTFNVGVGAACGSTLVRKINRGESASSWCAELFRWNRAGGKVVRGLTNRRKAEYKVCRGWIQP